MLAATKTGRGWAARVSNHGNYNKRLLADEHVARLDDRGGFIPDLETKIVNRLVGD